MKKVVLEEDKKERRYRGFWKLISWVDDMLSRPLGVLIFIGICFLDAYAKLCIRNSIEQSSCIFFFATLFCNFVTTALALLIAAATGRVIQYKE